MKCSSYLFEGEDFLSLQVKIEEKLKELGFQEATINSYDMEEVPLSNALEDLDTYGFLTTQKVIIVKHFEVVSIEEQKKDWEHFMKYVQSPNPDYLLIVTVSKLDERKKITKELKSIFEYYKVSISPLDYVKRELISYQVETGVYSKLVEACKEDITKIQQECNKLKMYCFDSKKISQNDVEQLVVKKLGDSTELTFSFSRALAERNKEESIRLYQKLLEYQIEPISIIGLLASQIRIIYQVKVLQRKRLSNEEIAKILKEKSSYRINKTKELTRYFEERELLCLMIRLQDMDLKIKSESVDPNFLIEMFLFNL